MMQYVRQSTHFGWRLHVCMYARLSSQLVLLFMYALWVPAPDRQCVHLILYPFRMSVLLLALALSFLFFLFCFLVSFLLFFSFSFSFATEINMCMFI